MDYTQEQLDKLVQDGIANATKDLMTKDDMMKEVSKETDRRVESGISKGLETQREKWRKEFEAKAKLTADELAKAEFDELRQSLDLRENELSLKGNLLEAKSKLNEAGIPSSYYEKLIGNVVNSDSEATVTNVSNLIDVYNITKSEIEANIKAELSKVPPADNNGGNGGGTVDKKGFMAMSYADKLAYKQSNPDEYNKLMK